MDGGDIEFSFAKVIPGVSWLVSAGHNKGQIVEEYVAFAVDDCCDCDQVAINKCIKGINNRATKFVIHFWAGSAPTYGIDVAGAIVGSYIPTVGFTFFIDGVGNILIGSRETKQILRTAYQAKMKYCCGETKYE